MSKNLDKEQIISKIDILLERSDCVSICNHLNELQNLIKKDEEFVLKIFDELDEESKDIFTKILDYLDGAIYFCQIRNKSDDINTFIELLSMGWTSETYSNYEPFRAKQYRNPILCETTDLFTETQNESEDQGFDKIDDFIEESYGSLEVFYISTLKDYYLENIKELINDIEL